MAMRRRVTSTERRLRSFVKPGVQQSVGPDRPMDRHPSDASRRPKRGTPEQWVVKSGPVLTGGSVTVAGIISAIIVGLIIGALGRLVVPGKQNIPIWLTIVIGIVAALVGTLLARGIGLATGPGFHIGELIVQVVLAALGVFLVAGAYNRRGIRG
jgi:uncharacterized membrane protein YeaQ/YmgE (transglycosylase-associated protein family)